MKNLLPHVFHLKFNQIDIDTHPPKTHSTVHFKPTTNDGGNNAKARGKQNNNNNRKSAAYKFKIALVCLCDGDYFHF